MTTHYSSLVEAGNGGGFVFAGITLFLMESEGGGGEISRRQKSTKGVYRKISTDYLPMRGS